MAEEKPKEEENKEASENNQQAGTEEKKEEKQEKKETKVNYIYGALLLHSAGKEINESNLKKVIEATGSPSDPAQIKALVSSLEGVDIDEAISQAAFSAAPVSAPAEEKPKEEKPSEKEQEKKAEEAAEGLSSLFG